MTARSNAAIPSLIAFVVAGALGCAGEVGPAPGGAAVGPVSPSPMVSVPVGDAGVPLAPPASGAPAAIPPPTSGCAGGVLPADVAQTLKSRCLTCHGSPPLAGVPGSLAGYEDLVRPAKSDPSKT